MMAEAPKKNKKNYELYRNAQKCFDKEAHEIFPFKEAFYVALEKYFPGDKPMYEDDFERFLEQTYGESPEDDEPVW